MNIVTVKPKFIEITTARTDASTDVTPLMPHNQGMRSFLLLSANLIPIGKGIPIRKPRGAKSKTDIAIREKVESFSKALSKAGRKKI